MPSDELYDMTIIGGGPAGMYAAFYGGMRDMKIKLVEAQNALGGFLHTYPEKMIWDVGGIPPIRCEKLIGWLSEQAVVFQPTVLFNQRIVHVDRLSDDTLELKTASGERHYTRTIVVAVGRGVTSLQKLEIEGANRYELTNLYYTVQNLSQFAGKRILISGGGNSAVDWANALSEVAERVTVVHRKPEFTAMERHVADMRAATKVRTPYQVEALHGERDLIHAVTIRNVEDGSTELHDVDAVVVNHGYSRDTGILKSWGFELGEWGLNVSERAETNIPGIFAAGDCAAYGSKVRLIAGAFTDAVLAVNSAKRYLDPEAPPSAYVSSHNDRFKSRNRVLTQVKNQNER
ncbi:NAD(P)/FAD-dependent oxidoreductase [Paenibacillus sp. IB182496]|uniref:Ferredoxin--NADP reductase n=1 Tax=Paenibacillus sabuli TaxID=2772509 RepID=A0A927GRJ7_9BACL|nr:NAD(P)/FAD-dependent oxidoreductase [Paenibacillus sabuli]MBD2844757.1 NAD(P)/FAD-dependent oxidoreductase [Paenibacillus sabuli]